MNTVILINLYSQDKTYQELKINILKNTYFSLLFTNLETT